MALCSHALALKHCFLPFSTDHPKQKTIKSVPALVADSPRPTVASQSSWFRESIVRRVRAMALGRYRSPARLAALSANDKSDRMQLGGHVECKQVVSFGDSHWSNAAQFPRCVGLVLDEVKIWVPGCGATLAWLHGHLTGLIDSARTRGGR